MKLEIRCPKCNAHIGYLYGIFQGSCKCHSCGASFGFHNVHYKTKVGYIWS